jgi:SAM-dependent methyltransferase
VDREQEHLCELGRRLRALGYRFITPTPETHRRVVGRVGASSGNPLTDCFGWSQACERGALSGDLVGLLDAAGIAERDADGRIRSSVRFSSLENLLLAHSAYPTATAGSVFFGPDTYRFGRALLALARANPAFAPRTVFDIGAGTGAGGLLAAWLFRDVTRVVLSDVNPAALRLAEVNAALNNVPCAECVESDVLRSVDGDADLIISNPPYLVDPEHRQYRHGGGSWGCELSMRIVEESLDRLSPTGTLLLYTGAPVVGGIDMFLEAVRPLLERRTQRYRYEEIDPDVFGEELEHPPYDRADRIATVALTVTAEETKQ